MENVLQELFLENTLSEVEIDRILNVLPQIAPPSSLVDGIMAAVTRHSQPQALASSSTRLWDSLEIFRVFLDPQQSC